MIVSLLFIPINCKITYTCLFTFFGNNYNISELTSATSNERMTTIIFLQVSHPLMKNSYTSKLCIRVCLPCYIKL